MLPAWMRAAASASVRNARLSVPCAAGAADFCVARRAGDAAARTPAAAAAAPASETVNSRRDSCVMVRNHTPDIIARLRIPLADVQTAQRILAPHFPPTRLIASKGLGGGRAFLKLETELPTASFKVRGAVYSLTVNAERHPLSEVVAASTGNHGAAVAYAGRLLNIPATIFLPERPNPVKAQRIRDLGARIVEIGNGLSTTIDAAQEYADRAGAFFLHDASDADIPAGTGTIAAEIVAQAAVVDRIYVPMGDTALIRGVASAAKALRSTVEIVGAVAGRAPAYALSWKARSPISTETASTIADGLAVTRPLAAN